jgi:putative transposase
MARGFVVVLRLSHRTRQVLLIAFDYHMRADLVTDAIETMTFEAPGSI